MSLEVQSRLVGDVTVVTCRGRIVEGAESAPLKQTFDKVFDSPDPYVVLDLDGVEFIDSAGLGLLLRYLARSRAVRGHLVLSSVQPKVSEVLRISRLKSVLESYDSAADAIAASVDGSSRVSTDILCVEQSVDVQCYVRELLAREGYGVLTAGNLPDALILLQAARPKVLVIGADLHAARNTGTAERFNSLANAHPVVELPAEFSRDDAGDAGQRLLAQVRAAVTGERGASSPARSLKPRLV
jgi:anti-sigma B factor antagonist